MRILINTSSLKGTGVTQVSVSFIHQCLNHPENEYFVFLSPNVSRNIDRKKFPSNFTFYEFGENTLYLPAGWIDLYKMKRLEKSINPDCVFSVFGPSWWTPSSPHIMGYAFPHYVYYDSPFFDKISRLDKIKISVMKFIHKLFLKRNGEYYVCETEDVRKRFAKYCDIDLSNVYVVTNTANNYFLDASLTMKPEASRNISDKDFYFYTLCSPYKHKNMEILNEVIPIIKEKLPDINVYFYTTFPEDYYNEKFSPEVKPYIINQGVLRVDQCPALVLKSDALFMPTLLECFSASYPEAMLLSRPIITSNLSFAKSICADAALYFNPLDPNDIAQNIIKLVNDRTLYLDLISRGTRRINYFDSPESRANKYLQICLEVSSKRND